MDNIKKRQLNIICVIIISFLTIASLAYTMKFDYRLIKEEGKHYIIFDDNSKYGMVYFSENEQYMRSAPDLKYPSAKELVYAVKYGNLTTEDKENIVLFPRDEINRIEICDFNNFYQPIPASGWTVSEVEWEGKYYSYNLENGSVEGNMRLYATKDAYRLAYQYARKVSNVYSRKTSENGKKTIIYYTDSSGSQSNRKLVRYSLCDVDKEVYIQKTYTLPEETLIGIDVFGIKGKAYYRLSFDNSGKEIDDISDATLLQFGVEKVVVISPEQIVVACLGLGIIGFVVYNRKKRKEEPIM